MRNLFLAIQVNARVILRNYKKFHDQLEHHADYLFLHDNPIATMHVSLFRLKNLLPADGTCPKLYTN